MAGWITPGRPNLMGSPVTHATGMIGAVLGPLRVGADIHVIDRWDPAHALEVMRAHGIGGGTGASVFLAGLLDHPDFTPDHAANMPQVGLGGAPVPVALGERAEALGITIIRAYGSTEHPSITGSQFDDPPAMRHRTDGRPLPGVEIRLVDEDGNEVPAGVAGEIFSRGPELCLGYTDAALNDAFDDDGWYRTGDIGVVDERRVPHDHRPGEGHHHPRWREPVAGRGRGGARRIWPAWPRSPSSPHPMPASASTRVP